MEQAHVYIKGKVVGVFFRAWTKEQAYIFGIKGWVRNVYDNPKVFGEKARVEAVFQGAQSDIEKMIDLVKQGSPMSQVESVEVEWEEIRHQYASFEIIT